MGNTTRKDQSDTMKKRKGKVKYKVTVKTNDVVYGGSDGIVQIRIIGDSSSTRLYTLNNWYDGFERDKNLNVFTITDADIGTIAYIFLRLSRTNEEAIQNYWFVEYIEITDLGRKEITRFPIYEWLVENHERDIYLCNNYTSIPQYDFELENECTCRDRRRKQTKQDIVNWNYSRRGFPGRIAVRNYEDLDLNLKTRVDISLNTMGYKTTNEVLQPFLKVFKSFENLDDFLLPSLCINNELKHASWIYNDKWRKDEEFGRQILNGINPGVITRCTKLPDRFKLTNTDVEGLLCRGVSLEEEIDLGNIYIVNHAILNAITTGHHQGKKLAVAAPICLLYLRSDNQLVPIAIQLIQEPIEDIAVWTPKDEPLDWLLAKMWFRNADLQVHQIKYHYALTHLISEIFAVAMFRWLPTVHPIYKLLKNHLGSSIPINVLARKHLFSKDGLCKHVLSIGQGSGGIEELLQKSFEDIQFDVDFDFPANITQRGMADIPNYHFRDDGLKLWAAIKDYAEDIVNVFYISNEDVVSDWELQGWIDEIHSKGFARFDSDGQVKTMNCGFPRNVATKIRLIDLLTKIIFCVTVSHAAVTYLQYDYLSFPPVCPGTMRGRIPNKSDKGNITMRRILDSLPDQMLAASQVELSFAMSCYSKEELFLTETPPELLFTDMEVIEAINKFKDNLETVENDIKERNQDLKVPYEVLRPSKIPYGISI